MSALADSNDTPPYAFTTLAGAASIGSTDGAGTVARFYRPRGIAIDRTGTLYVADTMNHTIRKVSPDGFVSTLAGTAGVWTGGVLGTNFDGTGAAAMFANPEGITVDRTGTVYVADKLNSTIRKITPSGVVTTWAGKPREGGSIDGPPNAARFFIPGGLAIDSAGNVYVAEWVNHVIRKITPDGVVTTLAGLAEFSGSVDGTGSAARFFQPTDVAVDAAGFVYVTDTLSCTIRRISPEGSVTTLAGSNQQQGSHDGTGSDARFLYPRGIAVGAAGNLYVADGGNHTIRKISPAGVVTTLAGSVGIAGSADGKGNSARFRYPSGLAADPAGTLYVVDEGNNSIRKISPAGEVTTLAGLGLEGSLGSTDGSSATARFNSLANTAVSPAGDIYVADTINSTVRKISPTGTTITLAGKSGTPGNADGTGSDARFVSPYGLAVGPQGDVYVADPGNDTIRKISPSGIVTTLAGDANGLPGSTDGAGNKARFNYPSGLAVDRGASIYVADRDNSTIRRISPDGLVNTLAGSPQAVGSTDGMAGEARFSKPTAIAADRFGNFYVADTGNHTIRKISQGGNVTTFAGSPLLAGSNDGTGQAARFSSPDAIAVDLEGTVFVADTGNHTIRKITPAGTVSTLGGLATAIGHADGMGSQSRFSSPLGVAVDTQGNLYVTSGTTVRKGQLATTPIITTQPADQSVAAGTVTQFSVSAGGIPAPTYQWYFNGSPFSGATSNALSFTNARASDAGDYTVVVTNALGTVTSNKATLTVTSAPAPTPSPQPSKSGGGGGGAPSAWFLLALLALGSARCVSGRISQ